MLTTSATICATVAATTREVFLQRLKLAQSADMIECRIDSLKQPTDADIHAIFPMIHKPAIFTCRAVSEGGQFQGDRNQQLTLLSTADQCGFDYLDIDLKLAPKVEQLQLKTKTIISYHNFSQTPTLADLNKLAQEMRHAKANILKFAVMANDSSDVNRLYQFLLSKPVAEKMIAIAMGPLGQMSRLVSPLLGGFLTFASIDNQATAPGQIDLHNMQQFYSHLQAMVN